MLIRSTQIVRVGDGLPLVATMETPKDEELISTYKKLGKSLIRVLTPEYTKYSKAEALPYRASVVASEYTFHYIVENGVLFLVLCDKTYPRLLAFSYLYEIESRFFEDISRSGAVVNAKRPYAFIKFEPFVQSTRKRYQNTRALKTHDDLADLSTKIQKFPIMHAQDILGDEYHRIMNNGLPRAQFNIKIPQNISLQSVQSTITNLTDASETSTTVTTISKTIIILSILIFFVDISYFVVWLNAASVDSSIPETEEVHATNLDAGYGGFLVLVLGVMSPVLLLQSKSLHSFGSLTNQLLDGSLIYAGVTILQLFHAYSCSGVVKKNENSDNKYIVGSCLWSIGWFGLLKLLYVGLFVYEFGKVRWNRWRKGKSRGHRD